MPYEKLMTLLAVMHEEMTRLGVSEPPKAFLRSCPVGVKSCFGANGFYDYRDQDPHNDLSECNYGPFTNDVSREGEGGGYPNSDAVRKVA